MIDFERDDTRFFVRVAGICVDDSYALLHRSEDNDFWIMPGGRCEMRESSREAVERELLEEIGFPVRVGRLLWIVENLSTCQGKRGFELAFFYEYHLPPGHPIRDRGREYRRMEELPTGSRGIPLIFQWFPIADLGAVRLFPIFLRDALRVLPRQVEHRIIRDGDG